VGCYMLVVRGTFSWAKARVTYLYVHLFMCVADMHVHYTRVTDINVYMYTRVTEIHIRMYTLHAICAVDGITRRHHDAVGP